MITSMAFKGQFEYICLHEHCHWSLKLIQWQRMGWFSGYVLVCIRDVYKLIEGNKT